MKNQHIPHLILGVVSSATPDEASVGFALASQRVKRMEHSPFSIEDLTSALASVESATSHESHFEFTLPADPGTIAGWDEDRAASVHTNAEADPEEIANGHLYYAVQQLLQWKWDLAQKSAKEVLRLSQVEETRDEALNALALSLAMTDEMDRAISALKQAVDGQWNFALQQNLGILAIEEDLELATNQATYWLDSAQTPEQRKQALLTVLGMLMSLQDEAYESDSAQAPIPPRVREAFRQAMSSDLTEETFGLLGNYMSQNDRDWVLRASNWAGAPLGASPIGNMILARAEGFEQFIDYLMDNAQSQTDSVQEAINRLVTEMNGIMLLEERALGPAGVSMNLFEKGLDLSTFERVLARPLTVREICLALSAEGNEPTEKVLGWLLDAKQAIPGLDASKESHALLEEITADAGSMAAAIFHDSRASEAREIFDNLRDINHTHSSFSGRRRINKPVLRQMAWNMRSWCLETRQIHEKCMQVTTEDDLRKAWNDLMQAVYQLESNIQRYL